MREITTTDGYKVLVDDEDYDLASRLPLSTYLPSRYGGRYVQAYCTETHRSVPLQRLIMNPRKHECVDIVNGNALDCRRSNLRLGTRQQVLVNRKGSRLRGATYNKERGKWQAKVQVSGQSIHLGWYDTGEDAAKVSQDFMKKIHGDFYQTRVVE